MKKELKKSQTSEVLRYLKTHKRGISSMQAFELFGATRLSAIIFRLRADGHDIGTIPEKTVTRYGTPTSYVRYGLKG